MESSWSNNNTILCLNIIHGGFQHPLVWACYLRQGLLLWKLKTIASQALVLWNTWPHFICRFWVKWTWKYRVHLLSDQKWPYIIVTYIATMLIVIRMQKLAQEQNEKIEKVNRERKFHQVSSILVIHNTVGQRPILWNTWLINYAMPSKTLHMSFMLYPRNGRSFVRKIWKSKWHAFN